MLTRLEGGVGGGEPGEGLGVLTTVILNLVLAAKLLLSPLLLLLLAPDASCDAGVLHNEDRILADFSLTVLKQ